MTQRDERHGPSRPVRAGATRDERDGVSLDTVTRHGTRRSRCRPRKYRNPYRDILWKSVVVRAWAASLGHADPIIRYRQIMEEQDIMQHPIEINIAIRGRTRTLNLPAVTPHNVQPALERIEWLRRIGDADQRVLEQAEASLNALARAAST